MKTTRFLALAVTWMTTSAVAQVSVMQAATVDKSSDILVRKGTPAKISEYREAVVIEFKKGGQQILCSGVLVTPGSVLTAAHRAYNGFLPVRVTTALRHDQALPLGADGFARSPATGLPDVQSAGVASFSVMDLQSVTQGRNLGGRDLMVVKLQKDFSAPVLPIEIAMLAGIDSAKQVRVVGFGENGNGGWGKKLFADVDVLVARCGATPVAGAANCEPGAEMFAKHPQGTYDTCPGDSGGPVYVRSAPDQYRLVGITSRATGNSKQCGGGSLITLLDGARLDWLRSQVSVNVSTQVLKPQPPACVAPYC